MPVRSPAVTLLHLSDLQFGRFHRFEPGTGQGSLLDRLREDLEARGGEGLRPDLVLLTGDLAGWGLASEFRQVEAFAGELASHLGLPRHRVILLPGNHDINRKAASAYFDQCASDERSPRPPYWPKWSHFAAMIARFYDGQPGLSFDEETPWSLVPIPALRVVVAALNSTMAESHRDQEHYPLVGEAQIRWFADKLRPYEEQGWLRIAAIHHDPSRWRDETSALPEPHREAARQRVDQDLRDLQQRLWPRVNLLLHGHIHEEQLGWLVAHDRPAVPAFGIGSGGLALAQRPAEVPNQYQWLRVHPDRIEYGSRAYVVEQKRWIGDNRVDRDRGERWLISLPFQPHRAAQTFAGATGQEPSPASDLALRVARYRERMVKEHRSQGLFDLATDYEDAGIERGLTLLGIFIPQSVVPLAPRASALHRQGIAGPTIEPPSGPPRGVVEVLTDKKHPWVFLLGAAGSGKSALTRWLVLKLCSAGETLPADSHEFIPVRLELRLFEEARQQAKAQGQTLTLLDHYHQRQIALGWPLDRGEIASLATEGRIYWLLDGLDEVADARSRQEITEQIGALRDSYPSCRGLVTSRPFQAHAPSDFLGGFGCETFSLEPFDDGQVAEFLSRWHPHAFPGKPEVAAQRQQRLLRVIQQNRSVRDLCTNPLLLTLVALLNRGDELPRRRHRLYERATELMISSWDANKGLSFASSARFQSTDKWKLLRRIAWSMMNQRDEAIGLDLPNAQGNVIEQAHLERISVDFCRHHHGLDSDEASATARALLHHLRERNYVLALLGGTAFGFVHRTFLEYLAAREAIERFRGRSLSEPQLETLVRTRWQSDEWQEVLRLLFAVLQEENPELVVRLLQAPFEGAWIIHPRRSEISFLLQFSLLGFSELDHPEQNPARLFSMKMAELMDEMDHFGRLLPRNEADARNPGPSIPPPEPSEIAPPAVHAAGSLLSSRNASSRGLAAEFLLEHFPDHPGARRVLEGLADGSPVLAYRLRAIRLLEDHGRLRRFRDTYFSEKKRDKGAGKTLRPSSKGLWLLASERKVTRAVVDGLIRLVDRVAELRAVGRPRRAVVRRDGVRVGLLEETLPGTRFAYDADHVRRQGARAISPVLPLRIEPFVHPGVLPFFANLLPEGALLDSYCQQFGLGRSDVFGLLLVAARDVAGAVEIVPAGEAERA